MEIDPDNFENSLAEQLASIRASLSTLSSRVSNIYNTLNTIKPDLSKLGNRDRPTSPTTTPLELPESAITGVPNMGIGDDLNDLGVEITSAAEKFEEATKRQGENQQRGINGFAGAISGIAGALMIQQIATMRLISQPYQYITQPALSTLSTMGPMADVLSAGLSSQESVLQEYRQMMPQLGGSLGAGLGFALGGTAGGVLGAGIGALASTVFNEPLANFMNFATGDMAQQAFEMSIGQKFINAEQYGGFVRGAMTPMLSLGLQEDLVGGLTQGLGTAASMMGYTPEVMSQLMTSYVTSLPSSVIRADERFSAGVEDPLTERGRIIGLSNLTASLESRGMSREASLDLYSTLSRSGSEDIIQSVSDLLIATTAAGQDDDYTLNVLVPALSRVVESRSIRNIARSSEEVEKGTRDMFAFISGSGTRLGDMIAKNPDAVLSQVFGMVSQTSEAALNDPARMAFLNNLGVSFMDVIMENENVLTQPLSFFSQLARFNPDNTVNREESVIAIMQMLNVMGLSLSGQNIQYGFELIEAFRSGDQGAVDAKLQEIADNDPLTRIADSIEALVGDPKGDILSGLTSQSVAFFAAMQQNEATMSTLLSAMQGMMSNAEVVNSAIQSASVSYMDALLKMLENAGLGGEDFYRDLQFNRFLLSEEGRNSVESLLEGDLYVADTPIAEIAAMFGQSSLDLNDPKTNAALRSFPQLGEASVRARLIAANNNFGRNSYVLPDLNETSRRNYYLSPGGLYILPGVNRPPGFKSPADSVGVLGDFAPNLYIPSNSSSSAVNSTSLLGFPFLNRVMPSLPELPFLQEGPPNNPNPAPRDYNPDLYSQNGNYSLTIEVQASSLEDLVERTKTAVVTAINQQNEADRLIG